MDELRTEKVLYHYKKFDDVVIKMEPSRYDNGTIHERSGFNRVITFEKKKVSYGDAGLYTCINNEYGHETSIYIWVQTKKRSFVTRAPNESYGILFRSHINIPCVPTSPCFDVKLFEGSQEVTINETNGIKFDPREGFLITNPSYIHVPIDFTCSVTVESLGRTDTVKYHYTKFNDE
ncbi:hypothetical protein HCN44_003789 [Aphidius gifuensis]|uniref:Uncharacterized protein n=1 Tax=Aphidius gifuensis TaxID=684658 RepID=A0A834XJ34_APHGI|nr:hypothetical protein HCN44_003789 [Aphidius gifuensis]